MPSHDAPVLVGDAQPGAHVHACAAAHATRRRARMVRRLRSKTTLDVKKDIVRFCSARQQGSGAAGEEYGVRCTRGVL